MNTIKIYFDESGSIKEVKQDFRLYQGQYQSKLINVYVPTSIMAGLENTSVKIGMKHVTRSGAFKMSRNYYMTYVKTLVQNNVEYALFERKLPKEFTMYVGQGMNAPQMIVNVVDMDNEAETPTVISVVTTQQCSLEVMPSADLNNDEAIEPTAQEEMNAQINALKVEMEQKQNKEDDALNTTAKTVVGGINENKAKIDVNTASTFANAEQIAGLRNDIADLTARFESGENYIGQMEGDTLPTSTQLNQFVEDTVMRATVSGDVVIFVLQGDPNRNYKYTYSANGWAGYELTAVTKADNDTYGLIKGTFGIDSENTILLDINNGEVLHIWVQDNDNTYRDVREYLNAISGILADIEDGTQPVGKALSANNDGAGNNIVDTYLTQEQGATKEYVKDYAMPKQFSNVFFIGYAIDRTVDENTVGTYYIFDGTSYDKVTLPQDYDPHDTYYKTSYDREIEEVREGEDTRMFVTTTGDTPDDYQIIKGDSTWSDLALTIGVDLPLSISNGYKNSIWVEASANCTVQFKLATQYQKAGQPWTNLNVELTEQYTMTAETPLRVDFNGQFLALEDSTVELEAGDLIRQVLYVVTQDTTSVTFCVYSNEVLPSTFNLIVESYVPTGATQVIVNGSPVSVWNANTKADRNNPLQGIVALQMEAKNIIGEKVELNHATKPRISMESDENNLNIEVEDTYDSQTEQTDSNGYMTLTKGNLYISVASGKTVVVNNDIKTFGTLRINNGTITYNNGSTVFSFNGGVSATGNISASGNLSVTGTGSVTGNLSTSGTMSVNGCTLSYNPTSQKLSISDNTHVGGDVDVNGKFIINGVNTNAEISYAGGDSDPVIINKKLETNGVVVTVAVKPLSVGFFERIAFLEFLI